MLVAVAYGPFTEVAIQVLGTLLAPASPQEAGTWALRRAMAVRKEASGWCC